MAALGHVYGLQGDTAEALDALEELKQREAAGFVSAYDKALVHLGLSDWRQALAWLEEAYKERSYWLIYIQVDPALDPLRGNPLFDELLGKVAGPDAIAAIPETIPAVAHSTTRSRRWSRIVLTLLALLLFAIVILQYVLRWRL